MSSFARSLSILKPVARSGSRRLKGRRGKNVNPALAPPAMGAPRAPRPVPLERGPLSDVFQRLDAIDQRVFPRSGFGAMARNRPELAADLLHYARAYEVRLTHQNVAHIGDRNQFGHHPDMLGRALAQPSRLRGLDAWLRMLRHKVGDDPARIHQNRALDVDRTFYELQEALRQTADLQADNSVHLGCDYRRTAPGSDLQVRDGFNRVRREIEVTSCAKPVGDADGLHGAVAHVAKKAVTLPVGSSLEGSVALTWAAGADPWAIVAEAARRLGSSWHQLGSRMQRLTLFSRQPGEERVLAQLARGADGIWRAEVGPFAPLPQAFLAA